MFETVRLGLLVFIAVVLAGGLAGAFFYMRFLTRQIIGHIKAAGLAHAALGDEFGPPPGVAAGVQAGRHRELHVVGSNRPARRVLAMVYRLAAG